MFLDYFALGVLIFVFLVIFYGIIILHDIPYLIAKKRNHPHADAIHVAGWVSLFTLHVIWPFFVDLGHALPPGAGMGNAKP
ncbi:inner membrane protein [Escherichia coli]|nr:inner membrane protein [Escherichia coli]